MKQSFREDGLVLKRGSPPGAGSRLRVVISKKVAKQAVRRNRMRRLIREAARREREYMKAGKEFSLVVLPGFEPLGIQKVQKILHSLLGKASLLE